MHRESEPPPRPPAPIVVTPLPPPPAPPAPAGRPDARALLESWRERAGEDFQSPLRELAQARAYLLEGDAPRAAGLLKLIAPDRLPSEEARLSLRLALAEAAVRAGDFARADDLLKEAEKSLRPYAPLRIADACFSADPRRREPVAQAVFRAGQLVTVCLELDRLCLIVKEGGKDAGASTRRVRFDLGLTDAAGKSAADFTEWERDQGTLEESAPRPWEDHRFRLTVRLPQGLAPGAHTLNLDVTDLAAPGAATVPRHAAVALPLVVR